MADRRRALPEAAAVSLLVLGLFYYWFGVADRYVIFLYGHVAEGLPPAEPFAGHTASRYWMAGLVAAGLVLLLYAAANWLLGLLAARRASEDAHSVGAMRRAAYAPAEWRRVWLLCAVALGVGIPAITLTVNAPTLPPMLAAACTVATLAGLAVALLPGRWAAERPGDLLWLAAEGVGLMPALLLLRTVELPGQGLSVSPTTVWLVALGGLAAGAVWLLGVGALRRRRGRASPGALALFLAGVGLSYLLGPLAHYLLGTPPGYRYITTAGNFFAANPVVQLAALAVAAGLAVVARDGIPRWPGRRGGILSRATTTGVRDEHGRDFQLREGE